MRENLPLRVKMCYGAGALGRTVQGQAASTFLLYFYTQALQISPGVAASIIFFGKVFDILNDPIIGAFVDKTNGKGGKCRSWIKIMTIPTALSLALCFIVPFGSTGGKIVWVIATYTIMASLSSMIQIPMNTLMGRLSSSDRDRSILNQISGIVALIANYITVSYTLTIAGSIGNGDLRKGFMVIGAIYGVLYALSYLVAYFGTKGYEPETDVVLYKTEIAGSIVSNFKLLFSNKIWVCIILYYLFDMTATTMEGSAMVYYFQYDLQDMGLLQKYSLVAMLCNALIFATLHIWTGKLGNAGAAVTGCIMSVSANLFRIILHDRNLSVLIIGWAVDNMGVCLVAGTVLLNIFDAKVFGEWKTGFKGEAILMSGFTLATKIGMALGSSSIGWVLELVGFAEGAETQSETVMNTLFFLNTGFPALTFLAVLVLLIPVLKIQSRIPAMKEEIESKERQ